MKRSHAAVAAGVGAAVFAASAKLAVDQDARPAESKVFHAVNSLPTWLYPVLWGPMQLGNLVVGAVVAFGVALIGRRPRVAAAALAATGLKLVVERVLRKRLTGRMEDRRRPGTLQTGAILRGDVPEDGHSFPSGHVILVTALAAVVGPSLPRRWAPVPWALAGLVGLGRVHVGAHNPLDVTAGFGIGLTVGSLLDVALGERTSTSPVAPGDRIIRGG